MKRVYDRSMRLRLTSVEHAEWQRAANERGLDVSTWMRGVCAQAATVHVNKDQPWTPPPPAQVRQALPPDFRDRIYAAAQNHIDFVSHNITSLAALEVLVANGITPNAIFAAISEWVPNLQSPLTSWTEPWLLQAYSRAQATIDRHTAIEATRSITEENHPPLADVVARPVSRRPLVTEADLDPPEPIRPRFLREPAVKIGEPRKATQAELARRGSTDRADIQAPERTPSDQPASLDWGELVAGYKAGAVQWDRRLGPEPGQPGCRAPRDVLQGEGY